MVDARGMSCPMPVVMVQKEVKENHPEELTVLVDNQCAVENVSRFAGSQGYKVEVKADGDAFTLSNNVLAASFVKAGGSLWSRAA